MGKKSDQTKQKVLESAKTLFQKKGFEGLKMQELADRAGVNKGLLHHYFHNKETLFNQIFADAFYKLFSVISLRFGDQFSLEEKIDGAVDAYFAMLKEHPNLPVFVLSELQRSPLKLLSLFKKERLMAIRTDFSMGIHSDEKGIHLVVTLVSLCVFPFMAKPIIYELLSHDEKLTFEQFIESRRPIVKNLLNEMAIRL